MIRSLLLFALIFLSSCMLGPNYNRPYVDAPEYYQYETPNDLGSLNMEWWKQFEDPVLEELIAEALANNYDVKTAAANIWNAIGIMIQTRSQLFPQIGYSASFNRLRSSETLATTEIDSPFAIEIPNPQNTWQAVITGSWEIDLWGRIRRLTEASIAGIAAAYEERQGVILSLVAAVADNYVKLLGLDEQLAISIRTMESYGEEVRYFETQFKYGQTSRMTVAQAKTQYETAAAKIPQIKAQIVQVENVINVLLSRNPQPVKRGKTLYTLKIPQIPAAIPSNILAQRPDIMQAEQNLIAANAQIGAARALYFPTISLTGFYGGASQELGKLFSGPSQTWSYTGSVVGPIFTFGNIYGQVLQAESQEQAALYTYLQAIQSAFADVENALNSHTMLEEQLRAETRLVEAAGDYQHLAELQYKAGYAPYYVVIQAQEQYFPAQLSWVQTRAQQFTSLVNIYQAMGGGWVDIAQTMTTPCCDCD